MKNNIKYLLIAILVVITLILVSCEKDTIEPVVEPIQTTQDSTLVNLLFNSSCYVGEFGYSLNDMIGTGHSIFDTTYLQIDSVLYGSFSFYMKDSSIFKFMAGPVLYNQTQVDSINYTITFDSTIINRTSAGFNGTFIPYIFHYVNGNLIEQ